MRAALVTAVLLLVGGAAPATAGAISFSNRDGITVASVKQADPRLVELTVRTAAIPATLNVWVLLPDGYAANTHRRYPVLYLLHGTSGTASDWVKLGDAEQLTAGKPLIVVMPDIAIDDGGGGWCTDWPNGAQKWETFHIGQLVPWVQANLRTINTRGERAIAGLSQGGFCSTSYAAQFPDEFSVALAYSGAPDIAYDPDAHAGAMSIINATEVGLDHVPANTFFGNPTTDYLNWAAHDPATLAPNLQWTKLYLYYGNGVDGPLDTAPNPGASLIEGAVDRDNVDFKARLDALGITPVVYDPYGNGTHSWPYWERDLKWSIGPLMSDFANPAPAPASFTYTTALPTYAEYGWLVRINRGAAEFSTLTTTTGRAFTLSGSGTAMVTTAPHYLPGRVYRITVAPATGAATTLARRADRHGRLSITVPLGPPDTTQEYSLGGPPEPSPGTNVNTTRVTITRPGGHG